MFHIDFIPAHNSRTGQRDPCYWQRGYTIDQCVKNGWLDLSVPGGKWVRKTIDIFFEPEEDDGDWVPLNPPLIPDPCYGTNLDLGTLALINGCWVSMANGGAFFLR